MSSIEYDPSVVNAAQILGIEQPHNDFIRIWTSFGTPALIAFIWLFICIFLNFYESYRKSSGVFIKAVSLGCFAALAAYIVNAATHNVMGSVFYLWILGGFSIATNNLVELKRRNSVKMLT
ncbi:MAG: hypothetical protein A2144_14840 [Chloroflexi bacterium RBG_16_50_9]|nr:MAG: hypothetical protein A2144_14840 [Chloroflexi bacterium RBG_16_50_9]